MKLGDLEQAIKFFHKSLTEHRTPDILTKLRETEKAKLDADKQAYIDPAKAETAREEGNVLFKVRYLGQGNGGITLMHQAGDFASAVKSYTEATKRQPSDPRNLNNRASA